MRIRLFEYMKDIDVRIFYYLKALLFKYRIKVYFVAFAVILREVLLRTPYLNILIADNRDILNAITLPLLLAVLVGFNGKKLIIISVALFFILAILSLFGHELAAEQLANNIYVLLVVGVISVIMKFVKHENE